MLVAEKEARATAFDNSQTQTGAVYGVESAQPAVTPAVPLPTVQS